MVKKEDEMVERLMVGNRKRSLRRLRSYSPVPVAACAAILLLAAPALGSSKKHSAKSSAASGIATAKAAVSAAEKKPAQPVPTTPIKNIAKDRGKTVYFIPLSADVPSFAIAASALKTALSTQGIRLDVCSGNFNPSQYTACFSQAINAHAGAIISDAVPWQLTRPLIMKASKKGIGVTIGDVDPSAGDPQAKNIAYIPEQKQEHKLVVDWMVADSGGKADVLLLEATDSPSSKAATGVYALNELKKVCPGCKYQLLKFSSSNENDLPSLISSAVLKNPNIDYIDAEFDQYVSFVTQGLQQANDTKVKIGAEDAALSGLQSLSQPSSSVKLEIANDEAYTGWMMADEALREMARDPVISSYADSMRVFTSGNIGSIPVTNAGLTSGTWFGSTSFESKFKKLWSTH